MNPETSFTYQGVTVNYSEAQKAIILADQNLIATLNAQLRALQNEYNSLEGQVAEAQSHLDNECNNYKDWEGIPPRQTNRRTNCINQWNGVWSSARNKQKVISESEIPTKNSQITNATKKLNDDIATIQNDIKLQIQTQLANTAAATAAAGNQATVTTAPTVAAANAAAQIEQLKNENEQAKLKQEQNIKIALFGFIAVVVIVIAVLVIRKVS